MSEYLKAASDRLTERDHQVSVITNVIKRVYGDTTISALEKRCAREIIKELERVGWLDPFTVRMVVAAAGGKITVSDLDRVDVPDELQVYEILDPPAMVLKTVRSGQL